MARIDAANGESPTDLGTILHAAHMLKTRQCADGLWPAALDARTGDGIETGVTAAPIALFQRLDTLLYSTEFTQATELAMQAVHRATAEAVDTGSAYRHRAGSAQTHPGET